MTFDLHAILESKRRHRARLAALPIAEKLRMLDDLRERAISLQSAAAPPADSTRPDTEEAKNNDTGKAKQGR